MSNKEKAENAIKWIESLLVTKYKQNKKGELGSVKDGFCCIGLGCHELDIAFMPSHGTSSRFAESVGLKTQSGSLFDKDKRGLPDSRDFLGRRSLTTINDHTDAGFKRIAKLLKSKPEWMFTEGVAAIIKNHYK